MILDYRFEGDVTIIEASGKHDVSDVHNSVRAALDDPSALLPLKVVIDVSKRTEFLPSNDDIRKCAFLFGELGKRLSPWRALVVVRDVDFGMGRMSGVFAEYYGHTMETFRNLEAALRWINDKSTSN